VLSRDFQTYFKRYVEKLLTYLGDDVKYWITINEPEVYSNNSFGTGDWPPEIKSKFKALQSLISLSNAHNEIYTVIKKRFPDSMVSFAKHNSAIVRGDKGIVTSIVTKISIMFGNDFWFYLTKNHFDYIGLNNYTRTRFIGKNVVNENKRVNDVGWELYPDSVYQCLIDLKKYNVPIVITENGLADSKDEHREWYIKEVVKGMYKAIKEGVDLRGYLHWSLLDNFEWAHGFWPEFGLIHVNRKDQKRTVRESAKRYGKISKENGIDSNE
jgi:beta-glucosidase